MTGQHEVPEEFTSEFVIAVAEDLAGWQKLNIVAFLTSGVLSKDVDALGEAYRREASRLIC